MLINFTEMLKTLKNEPVEKLVVKSGDDNKKPIPIALSLGEACADALLGMSDTDRTESGTEKFVRWQLASKVINAEEIELTAEDVTLIKDRVGKWYGPMTVGPVYNLLEGKPQNG